MAKHQNLTSPYAIHPFAYTSNADPASDAAIDMAPYKGWINTGSGNLLKVRNAANGAWEDVSVAGSGTTPAFGSNSNAVATANTPGASTLASRADHVHLGVRSIAHTSNTYSGPITIVAGQNIGITSSVSGTFRIDGSAAAGEGGGIEAGDTGLLAVTNYAPTTQTVYEITSTSMADVDATNLVVTFTAPASGNVLIRLSAWADWTVTGDMFWGLRESTTDLTGIARVLRGTESAAYVSVPIYLSGISAGAHTYKWSAGVSAGTGRIIIQDGSAISEWSPGIMEVWAAP